MTLSELFRRRRDELIQRAAETGDDWAERTRLINEAIYWQGRSDEAATGSPTSTASTPAETDWDASA